MAGNDLTNAGGLDGVTGFAAVGGALAVDETVRGGAGRAVFKATRNANVGQTLAIRSTGLAVVEGDIVEAAGLYGSTGASELALVILNGGGGVISRTILPRTRAGALPPRQGAEETLNRAYGLLPAPATGTAVLEALGTATANGAMETWLAQPYLDAAWENRPGYVWDPGPQTLVDLAGLRRWPANLPPILLEGYDCKPTPLRMGWSTDGQRELTQRVAGSPAYRMRGQMPLTAAQLADLDDFNQASDTPFLFVRPDTKHLCKAAWLGDGDPVSGPNSQGRHYTTIGLMLEIL